jgi:hypothetical protein
VGKQIGNLVHVNQFDGAAPRVAIVVDPGNPEDPDGPVGLAILPNAQYVSQGGNPGQWAEIDDEPRDNDAPTPVAEPVDYNDYTSEALRRKAAEREITVPPGANKDDIIALLEADDQVR